MCVCLYSVHCATYSFFSVFLLLLLGMYLFDERLGFDKCDVLCGIAIGMTTVIFHMKYDV